ncbi:hypothetical protein [Paracandidimonas soli]|uniref:Uncharacterized protein n=1 Tax=Paracandidimonas soli TaxID=1917182 RepID=A0A4R3UTZ6_9BURK|nr:hypothetical protein [Paracandidimonas soli]TCU93938.1 hypothetical protein EV686_110106 [Paracandidimonas soli]
MKTIVRDLVALTGAGCLAAGLYLQYGAGVALMTMGSLLLGLSVLSAWLGGR